MRMTVTSNCKHFTLLPLALFCAINFSAHAAVPVTEIAPSDDVYREPTNNGSAVVVGSPAAQPSVTSSSVDSSASVDNGVSGNTVGDENSSDSYYQMQLLQEEVRTLRGMIEELNNEVQQLRARQDENYQNLDSRIVAITAGGSANASSVSASSGVSSADTSSVDSGTTSQEILNSNNQGAVAADTSTQNTSNSAEKTSYDIAYKLLRAGKPQESLFAFKRHLGAFPSGPYAPSAHYWTGEIYLLDDQLAAAQNAFSYVVEKHPNHRKAADATFKLGQVYHLMGDKGTAKRFLDKAAQGSGNPSVLAKRYLEKHF